MTSELKFSRLHPAAKLPTRGSRRAAGLDLYAIESLTLEPGARAAVRTGLAVCAVLVSAAAAAVSWRSWRAVRSEAEPAGGTAGRNRFLAPLGLVGGGLGVLISLWLLATVLVLDRCLRP